MLIFLLDAKLREVTNPASQPRHIRGVRLCSFNSPFSATALLKLFPVAVPPTFFLSNAHVAKAPTAKILNHVAKSTSDSDSFGKVGVEQKGAPHTCERCQKPVSPAHSCHAGQTAQEVPSQPCTGIRTKQSGFTLRFWHCYIQVNEQPMVWFGSSRLKTPKVWVFQTNAPVSSAVTGVSPATRWTVILQINKIQGAADIPHCRDNCPHHSHVLIKLFLSLNWKKEILIPSNTEMNRVGAACWASWAS